MKTDDELRVYNALANVDLAGQHWPMMVVFAGIVALVVFHWWHLWSTRHDENDPGERGSLLAPFATMTLAFFVAFVTITDGGIVPITALFVVNLAHCAMVWSLNASTTRSRLDRRWDIIMPALAPLFASFISL